MSKQKTKNEAFFEQWNNDSFVRMYRARINDALSELRAMYDCDGKGLIDAPRDNENADDWQEELERAEMERLCEEAFYVDADANSIDVWQMTNEERCDAFSNFRTEFYGTFEFGDVWYVALEYLAHEFALENEKKQHA